MRGWALVVEAEDGLEASGQFPSRKVGPIRGLRSVLACQIFLLADLLAVTSAK